MDSKDREYRRGLNYLLQAQTAELIFSIQEEIFNLAEKYGLNLRECFGEYIASGTEEDVKNFVNELEELINDTITGKR